jgi:hypothetical protein
MKKLITTVALATAVFAAPAFAKVNGTNGNRPSEPYYKQQTSDTIVPSSNAYGPNY